jgi:hypothetical protein
MWQQQKQQQQQQGSSPLQQTAKTQQQQRLLAYDNDDDDDDNDDNNGGSEGDNDNSDDGILPSSQQQQQHRRHQKQRRRQQSPPPLTTENDVKKKKPDYDDDDNDGGNDETKDDRFSIFPRASTTLITCATNSGKTWFLRQVMLNRRVFIEAGETVGRVVYVNCNQRDAMFSHPWETEEEEGEGGAGKEEEEEEEEEEGEKGGKRDTDLIDLVSVGLHELAGGHEELLDLVVPGDVVILDDLQAITKSVEHLINYGAHHYRLVVFVVTQTCLGSPLYSLIKPIHNVVLLFANSSVSNLARHIKNSFFLSSDTRSYLERIFSHAEKNKSTVVLKINSVATSPIHRSVLAFSGVEGLFSPISSGRLPANTTRTNAEETKKMNKTGGGGSSSRLAPPPTAVPFCAVYPETKYCEDMMRASRLRKIRLPARTISTGFASDEAFVLVPVQNVQELRSDNDDDADDKEDDDANSSKKRTKRICPRRQWDEMNEQLESEIEAGFEFAKWNVAKNLMREILKCPRVCISSDYRLAHVDGREFSIVDFLKVATRKAGPSEGAGGRSHGGKRDDFVTRFVPLLAVLLANHAPVSYIINKRLYNLAARYRVPPPGKSSTT